MKYLSRHARLLLLGLSALVVTTACAREFSTSDQSDQQTARLIVQMIPRFHLSRGAIDDTISMRLAEGYPKELDPQKLYFLQSDIDQFEQKRMLLDDALKEGNVDFAYEVADIFKQRVAAQCEVAHRWIDAEHDFTVNEEMLADPDDRHWAKTPDELNERRRQWVKRELLEFRLEDKPLEEARAELHKRYRNIKLMRADQMSHTDALEFYLTELAQCYDPHSSYMSPQSWEDFEIQFRLSLDGIGAALRGDDGYTIVAEIVPGGAADTDGRLKVGDKITGVGQASGEIVDIFEMKLSNVVRMIRGERGTIVRLQIKPKDGGETQTYSLTRQKIELDNQAVKGEIIETADRVGRPGRIGVIHVPSFYRDFEGAQGGGVFKSAQVDLANVLKSFSRTNVDAVIVDLRDNGGGALSEAIEMSGHFIDRGPVVQVKDERGEIRALDDEVSGALYAGPLVVVCNRLSASASEIFAGVIKDYRRGLIVGDTTTHGKGTVQNLMDVSQGQLFRITRPELRGKLKLTIQQFYRVNGDSTQNHGVRSDVVLPSILDHTDFGESFLDHALPFDRIAAAKYSPGVYVNPDLIAQLQHGSEQRVAQNEEFKKLQEIIARYIDRKNRKTVTLNEAQARAERAKESRDAESEALSGVTGDPEAEEATPDRSKRPIFPESYYNDELLNISLDYVAALRSRAAAARN